MRTTNPIESVLRRSGTGRYARKARVANHRQADGLQAALRGIKDLAASQRHKSVAEGHRRVKFENGIEVIQVPANHAATRVSERAQSCKILTGPTSLDNAPCII